MDIEEDNVDFPDFSWDTIKIISFWRNGFFKITFTLIFPLTFCTLVYKEATNFILRDIKFTLSFYSITIWLSKIAYLTVLIVLSLLFTAVLVHRIITLYMNRSFIVTVIPLFFMFCAMFREFFVFNVFLALYYRCILLLPSNIFGSVLFYIMVIWFGFGYVVGFLVMNVVFLGMNLCFPVLNIFVFLIMNRSVIVRLETEGFYSMFSLVMVKLCSLGLLIQTALFFLYMLSHQEEINEQSSFHRLKSYLQPLIPLSVYFERHLKAVKKDLNKLL